MSQSSPDILDLEHQLDNVLRNAQVLVADVSEELAAWRPAPAAWSIAECLDHMAAANRVYLAAMLEPALRARRQGRMRRGPACPGLFGAWFVRSLEPPVKTPARRKAPRKILPRTAPTLAEAFSAFNSTHADVGNYLRANADLDLTAIRFPNPFVPGLAFGLATGLNVIAAHERRHLWQAWQVRRAAEQAPPG